MQVCVFKVHVVLHHHEAYYTNLSQSILLYKQAEHSDEVNLVPSRQMGQRDNNMKLPRDIMNVKPCERAEREKES